MCEFHFRRLFIMQCKWMLKSPPLKCRHSLYEHLFRWIFYLSANLKALEFVLNRNEGHFTKCHAINVITTSKENQIKMHRVQRLMHNSWMWATMHLWIEYFTNFEIHSNVYAYILLSKELLYWYWHLKKIAEFTAKWMIVNVSIAWKSREIV